MAKFEVNDDGADLESAPSRRFSPALVVGVVIGGGLAMLVVQNTERTTVDWLVFEFRQPLWVMLLVTAACTLVVTEVVGRSRRRRRRKDS